MRAPIAHTLAATIALAALTPNLAWAEDDLLATPPQRTLEGMSDTNDRRADRAARERARISNDPTEGIFDLKLRNITPTGSVGANFDLTAEDGAQPGLSLWLGAKYYPLPLRFSPFIALGAEIESYQASRPSHVDLLPTMRLGTSWMAGNPESFLNQLLPQLDLYAIGGLRMRDMVQMESVVAGFGISSPMMGPGTAFMLIQGFPLPNILEVTVERPLDEDDYSIMLHVGVGI